ncbi:patatin-like phospholipase family protein [Alkalibaculum bacchi]|uniref:patatin-like phospholipase family protein n=1 Tax=Alkalibaculum bacchi TaxID=645887 RepID=UPI0026F2A9DB|nr:patatin-like phospholipase family protein [Alkalibaculum bacchi]
MEYGLVLGGGGTMGSYEIGVWKALKELGINITAVSGTSIGAINGAIIAQNNLEWAIDFWTNLKTEDVFSIDKESLEKYNSEWVKLDFRTLLSTFRTLLSDGGLDISPLKENMNKYISEDKIRKSPIKLGLVTISLTDLKPIELMIDQIPEGKLNDYLLASAALPTFKKHEIDGTVFLDGGFYDNLPVKLLTSCGYENLITVSLVGFNIKTKTKAKDLNIINIEPSNSLGGILDFTPNLMRSNIQLGYLDTLRKFGRLSGSYYYIDLEKEDTYYDKFAENLGNPLKSEVNKKLPLLLGIDSIESKFDLIPPILNLLNRTKYKNKSIPLSLLEITANQLNIERLKVYKPSELIREILLAVNDLIQDNIQLIRSTDNIVNIFKPSKELPTIPLTNNIKFMSYYMYFISLQTSSVNLMTKLVSLFSPETVLSTITLLYLTDK